MKHLILILLFATSAFSFDVKLRDGIVPQKLAAITFSEAIIPHISWEHIQEMLLTKGQLKKGFIEADVTEYAYDVLEKVDKFIIEKGLDPLELSEQTIKLIPTGTLNLTNGWLQELSTINVSDAVIAKYTPSTKIFELTLPLAFDTLLLSFDYHTHIILLNIHGTISAEITEIRLNLHLGFNFTSLHAFVDDVDITNSGKINIVFTGLGLLDWIIDLLTGILTTLFHDLIFGIVDFIIQAPVKDAVDTINALIDQILRQNETDLYTY